MSNLFYPKKSKTKNLKKLFDKVNPESSDEDFNNYIHNLLDLSLESLDQKAQQKLKENTNV